MNARASIAVINESARGPVAIKRADKLAQDGLSKEIKMRRTLLKMGVAAAFMVVSAAAWAEGPNDGPKYPNMTSKKHYTDRRILDHNNGAPRYAVTSNPNRHYTDQRIMDHNNAAPRYAATTTSSQKPRQASRAGQGTRVVHTMRRRAPTTHANAAFAHHG
jgi:hypothetical protein